MAYALSMETCQDYRVRRARRVVAAVTHSTHICNAPPPPPRPPPCRASPPPPPPTIYCGVSASRPQYVVVYDIKVTFFGSIPLYIVVRGINSSPSDSIRPQYIVVGNVDKTFLDYIIIAQMKGRATAFCGHSYLKKIFPFYTITFSSKSGGVLL
jgi:hypothetical protein